MEQEETYTPYQERSLDELRRDINLKAEKLFIIRKGTKIILAILVLALVVFEALILYNKWIPTNWWLLVALICVIALVDYICYTIKKRLLSAMELAGDATQHFKSTKRLIRTQKWLQAIYFVLGYLLFVVIIRGKVIDWDWFYMSAGILGSLIAIFIKPPRTSLNKKLYDFYDDVEELSMYVE